MVRETVRAHREKESSLTQGEGVREEEGGPFYCTVNLVTAFELLSNDYRFDRCKRKRAESHKAA